MTNFDALAFAAEFSRQITMPMCWRIIVAENYRITTHLLSNRARLGNYFVPWYVSPAGKECPLQEDGAKALSLADVRANLKYLDARRIGRIVKHRVAFTMQTKPIEFRVPAYSMPDSRYVVLDGNHRLSALALLDVRFCVTICAIEGPMEPRLLWNLAYWLK